MTTSATAASAEYPFLVSVHGTSPAVPARKEDGYFWLRHQMYLGIVWSPKDITVLETYAPDHGANKSDRRADHG